MRSRAQIAILLGLTVLQAGSAWAATGTLMPSVFLTVLDSAGNPISGAKVCVYSAGTTTPVSTYTTAALTTANDNPIIADSAGRYVAYLAHGTSYKFVFQNASGTAHVCDGATFRTVDNVSAVPGDSDGVDITGTGGTSWSIGSVVYLSDGSGGRTAGAWYLADVAAAYASLTPVIGIATTAVLGAVTTGVIRIAGVATGYTGLTPGALYYVGSSGSITTTAPLVNVRVVGQADASTTALIIGSSPSISEWTSNAYAGGNFTATGGGGVTVDAADQETFRYRTVGHSLFVILSLKQFTITGVVTAVNIALPNSYVSAQALTEPCFIFDNTNAVASLASCQTAAGGSSIAVKFANAATAYTIEADSSYIRAVMHIEIQ